MELEIFIILISLLISTWACIILDRLDKIKDMLEAEG